VRFGFGFAFDKCGGSAPPPTLTAVSPPIGLAAGGTTLNLTGTGLVTGMATVCAGGTCTSVVAAADGKTATAVTGSMTPSTTAGAVTVTTGGGTFSLASSYTPWSRLNHTGLISLWRVGNVTLAGWTVPIATGGGPTVTASGTPAAPLDAKVVITANGDGTHAIFKVQQTLDGGATYVDLVTGLTAGAAVAVGTTGLTLAFGAGSYTTSHSYRTNSNAAPLLDQNGANNQAQASATLRPAEIYDANGRLRIAYDGVNDYTNIAIAGLAQPYSYSWCMRARSSYSTLRVFFDGNAGGTRCYAIQEASTTLSFGCNAAKITRTISDITQIRSYGAVHNSTNTVLFQDGAQLAAVGDGGTQVADGVMMGNIYIGGTGYAADVDYYELSIMSGTVPLAETQAAHLYDQTYYGAV
jgi:hypothetical protein